MNKKLLVGLGMGGILLFLIFNSQSPQIQASASDNVSGWAWSENIGWISLNCVNTNCLSSNYGVNIDSLTGNFSGFAWSENIGWIQFNPAGPYPSAPSYSAKLDFGTRQVTGWIRVCAGSPNGDCFGGAGPGVNTGGWDGWIKLAGSNYQTVFDFATKKFSGWAWGSDVIGWISWNSSNCDVDGNGFIDVACGGDNSTTPISPFGGEAPAFNAKPLASDLNVSSVSSSAYCPLSPQGLHSFSWDYSDPDNNNESQFQFQVDDDSEFNTPEINREIAISLPSGSTNNQMAAVQSGGGVDSLDYNQTYYWRVKVFDSGDPQESSDWVNGSSFATAPHPYPKTDFIWSPNIPEINKITEFTDKTIVYGGASIFSWDWQFQNADPSASSTQNPAVTFLTIGTADVYLKVIDSDSYLCEITKTLRIIKEIKIKEI